MNKLKIALVSDSIAPYNLGGKETRSYEIATRLAKKGHDVHFYTMKLWKGHDVITKDGITLHGICKEYNLYNKKNTRSIKQAIMFGLHSFKLIKEDFDILEADHMVYFHLFPLKLICKIKQKPFFITWHEVWGKDYWQEYIGKKGLIGAFIEKHSSSLPDKIIAISTKTKNDLIKSLNVPASKISIVENGIDLKKIKKIKASKDSCDILYAGRLNSHKNVDILIKAIAKLVNNKSSDLEPRTSNQNPQVIIAGMGPELKTLKSLSKELNLEKNIKFLGHLKNFNQVLSLMKSAKLFVSPSTREGFGMTIIEANALGTPTVTTDHKDNASKDLIKNGSNGYISKLTINDLAKNINKGLKSSAKMKKGCLKNAEKYDWGKMITKLERAYKNGK